MKPDDIVQSLLHDYSGTVSVAAWGETSIFYNPDHRLPRGVYFATIKEKDGDNDKSSGLNRTGVYRFNIGTSKVLFAEHFGEPPARPAKGRTIAGRWEFKAINTLLPHPIYAWMAWVAVNSPDRQTFNDLRPLIDAAYNKAIVSFNKRISK